MCLVIEMPRSRRASRRPRRRAQRYRLGRNLMSNVSSSVTISGRFSIDMSYSASFSFSTQEFRPSAFSRLDQMRTIFEQYRWESLRITGMPGVNGGLGITAFGYWPGSSPTTPSGWNYSYVAALECSRMVYPAQTTPVSVLVPGSKIHTSRRWFSTNDTDGIPGRILVGGPTSTAVSAVLQIDYVCTFATPVADNKE